MTLSVNLPPDLASRVLAEAARRHVEVDQVIQSALDLALPPECGPASTASPVNGATFPRARTPEEVLRAIDEFERKFAYIRGADIPDEALRRENMYEDRGL